MDIVDRYAQTKSNRIARLPEACAIIGLSPSTVRNRLKQGGRWFDPRFPTPIRLGTGRRCAIGWRVDELMAYISGDYGQEI
jgi:prophage regulatory protein